jgi:hypothetical protein
VNAVRVCRPCSPRTAANTFEAPSNTFGALCQSGAVPQAVFDVLEEWFRHKEYHGCSFGQAATEFRDPKHAVHKMASEHKQQMLAYFRELAAAAGARDPELLAQQMDLLVEGAIIHMEVIREPQVARIADDAAQKLVDKALG